ncbi:MAG: 50S ribosomal protein L15 [bacterium]
MRLHTLQKTTIRSQKRVGRGYGSGKGGHTSGRGAKGQKARSSVPSHFVGSSWVWFKRLPFLRGKSKFKSLTTTTTLTLSEIDKLPAGSSVDATTLHKANLISKKESLTSSLKIVATGKLTKKLIVEIAASSAAVAAIKQAGGEYRGQNI